MLLKYGVYLVQFDDIWYDQEYENWIHFTSKSKPYTALAILKLSLLILL